MVAVDVGLHLLHSRIHHHVLQQGVRPHAVPPLTRLPPHHPAVQPVVESDQHTTYVWGHHAGTTNPRGTRKPDNPLKGIRNPIPRDPDNPLKGIRDLVQNGTRNQWLRGLTIPT